MKKEWQKPELEVLDVNMTMLDPNNGNNLDHSYPTGTPRPELTWS
ncbi:paeninodin family lasso peptide [Paenibacillus planticolens]|uniref:Paeninodin family lasso peptide n=1 Tax=Paenibacillus planticolens TaxID=2654976 RepID=A0ABX1ZJF9_9BACL|nr:paeninodin family lasso peptide [Paenibacillus planticolens]NOV00222.1 paeninodin family lasso peptide [Paenibacillus planticolens]